MLGVMKLRVFFYIACLTWTSLYGMSGCHHWHPVIQQDQLSVETEVNYKITPPLIESDQSKLITWCSKIPGHVMTFIPRARVEYINSSRRLARKYSRIFVRGHYLFREENSFPRAKLEENCQLQGTDNFQGQIFEHIFAPNGDYCLYYPSNLFRNARSFENWGIFSDIPQF